MTSSSERQKMFFAYNMTRKAYNDIYGLFYKPKALIEIKIVYVDLCGQWLILHSATSFLQTKCHNFVINSIAISMAKICYSSQRGILSLYSSVLFWIEVMVKLTVSLQKTKKTFSIHWSKKLLLIEKRIFQEISLHKSIINAFSDINECFGKLTTL